jgi:hypothetical protein
MNGPGVVAFIAALAIPSWVIFILWTLIQGQAKRIEDLEDSLLRAGDKPPVFRGPTREPIPTKSWFGGLWGKSSRKDKAA